MQEITPNTWREMGLTDAECQRVIELLGREPNYLELGVFSVMWSEHCSYKTSRVVLDTFPTKGEQVLQGPGENAGIVDIGDGQAVAFKMESHNHPSAVEPYQGAATGVGGILRDIFTMGARPMAVLNSVRFGPLDNERTRYLFKGVAAGASDYANIIGVPMVGGEIYFAPSYEENPLANVMALGLIDHEDIKKGLASGVGNPVMVVGARTGRDGIHGATFASDDLSAEILRPTVQAGDPFLEKLLMEACLEVIKSGLVVGIQDMGAAGLTSSSCEMASRAGTGIEMDLLRVPRREEGMTSYELMLSESQERMLLVVKAGSVDQVTEIFNKWDIEAVEVGQVTDDGMLRLTEGDQVVAEIPATALTDDAPVYERPYSKPEYLAEVNGFSFADLKPPTNYSKTLLALLASPNIASKEWFYRQADPLIGINTVVGPGSDAAVLRIKGTNKGIAATADCNSRYCYLDPYVGGTIAVAEAARNLVCSGAKPLAITNCLNFANPEKPDVMWQFRQAVTGIGDACRALNTPVTGGNVSLYNETKGVPIYPTPTIGMVGILDDIQHHCTQDFKDPEDIIILVGDNQEELGGSEYLTVEHNLEAVGRPPKLNLELEAKVQEAVLQSIKNGWIKSAHDCAEGGLAVALAESCITGKVGAEIAMVEQFRADALLFGETQSRIIITTSEDNVAELIRYLTVAGVPFTRLGHVTGTDFKVTLVKPGCACGQPQEVINVPVAELSRKWRGSIQCLVE